jgi:hypothetical protein
MEFLTPPPNFSSIRIFNFMKKKKKKLLVGGSRGVKRVSCSLVSSGLAQILNEVFCGHESWLEY